MKGLEICLFYLKYIQAVQQKYNNLLWILVLDILLKGFSPIFMTSYSVRTKQIHFYLIFT
jgi:hypothetical protein